MIICPKHIKLQIYVLPRKSESFEYSALESLSLGIYTILNDIPTFNGWQLETIMIISLIIIKMS